MLKIYKNLKPYTPMIIVALILIFFQAMSDLYLPTIMSDIVDSGIMKEDVNYIWREGGLMLLISGGGAVCAIVACFLGSKTAMGLGTILRNKIFDRVEDFSLHEFDAFGESTLVTRTTNDIIQIQTVTILLFNMVIRAPFLCIGGIIQAYSKDRVLTIIILISILVVGIIIFIVTRFVMPLFKQVQKKLDRINLILRENLTGIRVIRAFNREEHENKRFGNANKDLTTTYIKVNRIIALLMPVMMLTMNLVMVLVLWFGSVRVNSGNMDMGALFAFTQYVMQIMFALITVTIMFVMLPRGQAAAERINEVLSTTPEIVDSDKVVHFGAEKGYISFENVSFSYKGAEEPAIADISFEGHPGETIAIIGGTGSGKSTLVNLIPRFYEVSSGEVLVDGVNVKDLAQHELRSVIGFVPQKAVLFTGTIADNIRYGKKDATDEEVEKAAKTAQADDFIRDMKDGYNTMLSEGGLNLSGGQKQRLSIARALVRRPEIYVFDDSFSALDFKTDAKLRAALRPETREATVIIVAQRVGSVMGADRIIVLDDGKIAGSGTHDELMKGCEVYREIVSSQLSEEELA